MSDLSENTVLDFLKNTGTASKNDIAKALNLKGDDRIPLKDLLHDLEERGLVIKAAGQIYGLPTGLPDVMALRIADLTLDGDVIAVPVEWDVTRQGEIPRIEIEANAKDHATLQPGNQILARLRKMADHYEAKIIRRIDTETASIIGEVTKHAGNFVVRTLSKRTQDLFDLAQPDMNGAVLHDLVRADLIPARRGNSQKVIVTEVLGRAGDPKIISLVAAHESSLRINFPAIVVQEAEKMARPTLGENRIDLRNIPLVTIDGEDARDFDDAVFAEPDADEDNRGGFHLMVAIADVSYYVRSGTALDDEAFNRGNSTYFPDRVLPMLPEGLSNDLCSLKPKEDRYCLAVHMWIDKNGQMKKYKFVRGLMKSIARLTYARVQAAYDGRPDDETETLTTPVIMPLYEAYKLLTKARRTRGTLELELPERKIVVDEAGNMTGITLRERYDSHKLIEEFMVLANVAAALALKDKKAPCVYRVHDRPSFEKINNLRTYLATFHLSTPKGNIEEPAQMAEILRAAAGKPFAGLISDAMLRSQMQAHYATDNIGHFGLALNHYAHFTSPIRRYADLIVHRSLIRAYGFGEGGLSDEEKVILDSKCEHISITERQSMEAERNAVDRFTSAYMADKVGATFDAQISSVTRFGLFVRLTDTGADGLVPIRILDGDFYIHDERLHALIGRRTGRVYRLGAKMRVELIEVSPLAGGMLFRPAEDIGADIPGFELSIQAGAYGAENRGRGPRRPDRDGPKNRFKSDTNGRGSGPRGPRSSGSKPGKPRR